MQQAQSFFHSIPRYARSSFGESAAYRPLLLQCGPEKKDTRIHCALYAWIRTWLVCWPDHCDPSWTVISWTIFSCVFYFADLGADLSVAMEYLDSKDYVWFGLLIGFTVLPVAVSVVVNICYARKVWYEVYPVGIFYWSYWTIWTFLCVPRSKTVKTMGDARNYIIKLRKFQDCNRERTRVADLDVYFGALPQLILQAYIAAEVAIETGVYKVTWNSWVSLALSSLSLLRYEPTARESKEGIVIDVETVLEPALYDYIAENLSDLMSVVPRAVAIGCFLTVEPSYAAALGFFSTHMIITFLWFWLSAPKKIPGYRSTDRDFRGQRRDRHDYMDHFQAALATLLFPPTHRTWPENFQSWTDRFMGVATKQFCVVTVFQLAETLFLLAVWTFLTDSHVPVVPTLIAVICWTVARILCHVAYYVCILFPLYICEWEGCCRRRGLIAKMEIIRMDEELGGYFCRKLEPRLERIRDLCHTNTDRSKLREECSWLVDHLLDEAVGAPTKKRSRTQKHRLQAMVPVEKDLFRTIQREAGQCIRRLDSGEITGTEAAIWENIVTDGKRLAHEWGYILLACLTHQKLPMSFIQAERDLGLAQYPEMFQKLVTKNDLCFPSTHVPSTKKNLTASPQTPDPVDTVIAMEDQESVIPKTDVGFGQDFTDIELIS